jgi:RNA polymerase sigma-70 factor (family 1)
MANVIQGLLDEELLQRCSNDDIEAYNVLFDRYAPKLYKLGMRYLKDRFVVEELAIDLLYNIWERRHSLKIEVQFSAYLFRAMSYKSISYLRKSSPQMLDIDAIHEDVFLTNRSADYNLLCKEAQSTFSVKLNQLSPQRRKVFELSREHNLSYADIAKELNLSVNTVENHMVAALLFLRKQYKHSYVIVLFGLLSALHILIHVT